MKLVVNKDGLSKGIQTVQNIITQKSNLPILSYLLMAVWLYILTQRIYPIQYELKKILKIGLISLLIFISYSYILILSNILFKFMLIGIYLILIYTFKIIDPKEIHRLKYLISKFYGKISSR